MRGLKRAFWRLHALPLKHALAVLILLGTVVSAAGLFPSFAEADFGTVNPLTDSSWGNCADHPQQDVLNRAQERGYLTGSNYTCRYEVSNPQHVWLQSCGLAIPFHDSGCYASVSTNGLRTIGRSYEVEPNAVYFDTATGQTANSISQALPVSAWNCDTNGRYNSAVDEVLHSDTYSYTCRPEGAAEFTEVCSNSETPTCYIRQGGGYSGTFSQNDQSVTYTSYGNRGGVVGGAISSNGQTVQNTSGDPGQTGTGNPVLDFILGLTLDIIAFLLDLIVSGINLLLTGILAFVSALFDWVSIEFVIQMGKYVTSPEAYAVRNAWTLIRDIANIGIIGGLVATAIGTILGNDKYNVNKTLARIIIAALLVNFSYFFAGALIDASNFVAKEAFQLIYSPNCTVENQCGPASRFLQATALGDSMESLRNGETQPGLSLNGGQTDANDVIAQQSDTQTGFANTQKLVYHVMQAIFLVITGFVFLSAIALLVGRFIALIFLIITSPIGIAGTAVPILKSYADEWWKALRSQALFAPVYFLLVAISLNILDAIHGALQNTGAAHATVIGIIAMFTIAIGFMWAALSIAKSMSAEAKWFSDIYKQAGNALGWLPGAYTSGLRTAAGLGLRETVGRGALWLGDRQRGAAVRIQQWAKSDGIIPSVGRAIGKYTGTGELVKAGARGLDRALQAQLDKTSNQKFMAGKDGKGGVKGFRDLRDEKLKRKAELQAKREKLENEDKRDGREAERDLNTKQKNLRKSVRKDAAELARLEALDRAGRLTDPKDRARLESLRKNKNELANIDAFKARLKAARIGKQPLREAGVVLDPHTDEKLEGGELANLYRKRRELQAQGIWSGEEMETLDKKIREQEAFEAEKDKYNWGGADGMERRGRAKYERAIAEGGEQLKGFNEKKHAEFLRGKQVMSDTEEADYIKALNTPFEERTAAQNALLYDPNRKITKAEKAVRDDYEARSAPITAAEDAQLRADIAARDAGRITDPKRLAQIAAMESRRNIGGVVGGPAGSGLSEKTVESYKAFAARQQLRVDGFEKRKVLVDKEKTDATGIEQYKLDDLYGYKRGLETGSDIKLRDLRGERTNLVDNLGVPFIKEEYKKNPNRIIQYATALNDEDWETLSKDHDIDEGILNKMRSARTRRWGDEAIRLQQDLLDGKVVWGSEEFNQRSNDIFNQQVGYIQGKEFLSALRSNAIVGELRVPGEKEPIHVRYKDLNTVDPGGAGDLRRLTWNTTSSTMFANAKESNVFGRNLTAEIAKAKRSSAEKIIVTDHAVSDMLGLDGDNFLLSQKGGKIQADATGRARKATKNRIAQTEKDLQTYTDENPAINVTDVISLRREKRFAELHQDSVAGNGPFNAEIAQALRTADRNQIRTDLSAKLGVPPQDIAEEDVESYIKLDEGRKIRERVFAMDDAQLAADPRAADQKLVFEMQDENDAAGEARMEGWTPKEAGAAINDRSLHSTAIQKHATEEQIPVLMDGPDPAEKVKFVEGLLLFRSEDQINAMLRNPAIQAVWIAPTKEALQKINVRRLAENRGALKVPTKG